MSESGSSGESKLIRNPRARNCQRERALGYAPDSQNEVAPFSEPEDHAVCRALHRRYGKTYYFASRRFPRQIRQRVDALYGFVRLPDEWVDNPGEESAGDLAERLSDYRAELIEGMHGVRPGEPVLRAFCDVAREIGLSLDEPLRFLDAMEQDLDTTRYGTYAELRAYMRGSAASVELMMCKVLEVQESDRARTGAIALGEAMQLTNFLRDIGEDLRRGRIYLPVEDIEAFGVREEELALGVVTPQFVDLMKFEIARARALYTLADPAIELLPVRARPAVRLGRVLYARILDRIEDADYDVFGTRARTSTLEKIWVAARLVATGR
jgi:phytoene synthase